MTGYREMVIKIPEEIISFVNLNGFLPENYRSAMGRVLLDGVELPKGHGRLIDADDIRVIELEDSLHIIRHEKGDEIDVYIDAPTIIEADKGE